MNGARVTLLLLGVLCCPLFSQDAAKPTESARTMRIRERLEVLRDPKVRESDPKRLVESMQELGALKATEGINDIVSLIALRQTFEWEHLTHGGIAYKQVPRAVGVTEFYPATGALVAIGGPAAPTLVNVIARRSADSLESVIAHNTIMLIFRDDTKQAIKTLKKAAARASSEEAATRLVRAVQKAERYLQ
jgi:hypothetical protein